MDIGDMTCYDIDEKNKDIHFIGNVDCPTTMHVLLKVIDVFHTDYA